MGLQTDNGASVFYSFICVLMATKAMAQPLSNEEPAESTQSSQIEANEAQPDNTRNSSVPDNGLYVRSPSAIPLQRDQAYLEGSGLIFTDFTYGLTHKLSINAGTALGLINIGGLKLSTQVSDSVYVGLSLESFNYLDHGGRNTTHKGIGLVTIGNRYKNISFGAGVASGHAREDWDVGVGNDGIWGLPVMLAGQLGSPDSRISIVTENWYVLPPDWSSWGDWRSWGWSSWGSSPWGVTSFAIKLRTTPHTRDFATLGFFQVGLPFWDVPLPWVSVTGFLK